MIFIDSNILAYAFYDNKNTERCQQLINSGGIINTVNLIEAYNIISYETSPQYAAKAVRSLLKSNIHIVNADVNLIFESLKRTSKYKKLKFMDLVHYTTALLKNCTEIASYDTDFDGLDIKRTT